MSNDLTLANLPGVAITTTGLQLSDQLSNEQWSDVGVRIRRLGDAHQWYLGDWWRYGEDREWGNGHEAAERANVNYNTIRNYAAVCRAFDEVSRQRDNLTFTHFQESMAAAPERREYWLACAEKGSWSVSRLRAEIKKTATAISDQTNRAADRSVGNEVDPEESDARQKATNAAAYDGETEGQAELEPEPEAECELQPGILGAAENEMVDTATAPSTTTIPTATSKNPTKKKPTKKKPAKKKPTKKTLVEAWDGTPEDREAIRDLVLEEFFAQANGANVLARIKNSPDLCKAVLECIETPLRRKLERVRAELKKTRAKLDAARAEVKKLKNNNPVKAMAIAERDRSGVHHFRSSRHAAGG